MSKETVGIVKVVSTPIIDEGIFRYAVYLRLPKDVPVNELECLIDIIDSEKFRFVDVKKFDWKNREDDILWKVICEEDGRTPPNHKYIIYLKSDEKIGKDELKYELTDMLEELNVEQIYLYMTVKTIKRFPWEKPTVKKIPIPKEVFERGRYACQ